MSPTGISITVSVDDVTLRLARLAIARALLKFAGQRLMLAPAWEVDSRARDYEAASSAYLDAAETGFQDGEAIFGRTSSPGGAVER